MANDETIQESQNTLASDVNEIMTGYYALGGTWEGFENASEAKKMVEARKNQISSEEYEDQLGRAKVMAEEAIEWANENNFNGKVIKVWWTARPGMLSKVVGYPVDSKKNPTDILFKFQDESFLGISAKSTKGSGDIGFKNPGIGSLGKALGVDFNQFIEKIILEAIEKYKLPLRASERKKFVRSSPDIQEKTREVGSIILSTLRDSLFDFLNNNLDNDEMLKHIKSNWIDAEESLPVYIKVTGYGRDGFYSASVTNPIDNPRILALASEKITIQKVGSASILIVAGKLPIMKIRWKWTSEPLASSIKLSGDPVNIKQDKIQESGDILPVVIDLGASRKGKIEESFLRMFGGWIEVAMGRMFGVNSTPISIRGTPREIEAFGNTLQREKKYANAYQKYGLDNPKTYSSKYSLDKAIQNFEKETGIKWPLK